MATLKTLFVPGHCAEERDDQLCHIVNVTLNSCFFAKNTNILPSVD